MSNANCGRRFRRWESHVNGNEKKTLNARGHCKLCKSWKVNGVRTERLDGERYSDHVRRSALDAYWDEWAGVRATGCEKTGATE